MWKFRKLEPGEPERNPHETEFFRLTDPAEAVVREFIQNSLDARSTGEQILVCYTFSSAKKEALREYFDGLKDHLQASNFPLTHFESSDTIPFLTVEDFGTTGLDGVTGEDGRRPEERSNFYNFWWCEGKSLKRGQEAGRWGLGKTTFHIVSRLRSFWGITVRQDDSQELLMGKALLKTHRLGNEVYSYYGYFSKDDKPIRDREYIRQFKQKFAISRNNEPGLSIIIPLPDEEIKVPSILKSAIIHYFHPIMKGSLVVKVKQSGNEVSLNKDTMTQIAMSQDWQGTSWEGVDVGKILEFVRNSISTSNVIELSIQDEQSPEITIETFGNRIDELKNSFNSSNFLAFKVPLKIWVNNGERVSYFEVNLQKHPQLRPPMEFYIRSGIRIIPGQTTIGNRPICGMLVAEDAPVAEFLGDAENPAHTEWNERTEGFRDKYQNAARMLRFIKKTMSRIISILDQPPQEQQKDFLKEIFFVPERLPEEDRDVTRRPDIRIIERRPSLFEITRVQGGFKASLRETNISLPLMAKIMVAYDVRKGNPFKQYEPADFDFGGNRITISSNGCTIRNRNRNTIECIITGTGFNLEVTGLDPNRDIVVDVKEIENETQV